jgi:hypothetical protein
MCDLDVAELSLPLLLYLLTPSLLIRLFLQLILNNFHALESLFDIIHHDSDIFLIVRFNKFLIVSHLFDRQLDIFNPQLDKFCR